MSVSFEPEEFLADFFVFYFSGATPTLDKRASTSPYDIYVAGELVAESVAADTAVAVQAPLRSISPEVAVVEAGSADLSDPVFTAEVDFFTELDGAFSLPDRYSLTFTDEGEALRLLLQRDVRTAASDPARSSSSSPTPTRRRVLSICSSSTARPRLPRSSTTRSPVRRLATSRSIRACTTWR